jgi:hypothetical protein
MIGSLYVEKETRDSLSLSASSAYEEAFRLLFEDMKNNADFTKYINS